MNVLLIDNKDSFTYNLSQLIARVTGRTPVVIDNAASHWRDVVTEVRAAGKREHNPMKLTDKNEW